MAQDQTPPTPPSPATSPSAEAPAAGAAPPDEGQPAVAPPEAQAAEAQAGAAPAEPAAPAGPKPLDPQHLMAAVSEAMVLSGLGSKANLVETVLLSAMSRFVNQGTIDLGLLWQTLVTNMYQAKDKTAQAMLLTAIYIAKTFQVPVAVPQEAQELMETLLPSEEERSSAGERLEAAVEARLARNQVAQSGAAAAAAAVATSGKHGPAVSTSGKHGQSAVATSGKHGPAKADPPKVAELLKPTDKKKRKGALSLNDPKVAAASGVVFLVLCGYWVNELVIKEIQLDRKRQEFYAKRSLEASVLPANIPVKEAFVMGVVLKVHLADDKLAQMPEKDRAQIGADLLASLDRVGALRLSLFSDAKRYVVRKDADGLVTVQVFNSE